MTIRTTRWTTDTCGCTVDYTVDDSQPPDSIVPSLSNVVSKCSFHSSLPTDNDVWDTLKEENPRKNNALQHILDNGPTSLFDVVGTSRMLKQGITFNFSWSGTAPNRVLTVSFTGVTITTAQRNTAQTFLNNKFGVGKVILA
jgi:hypothetical protein